MRHAGWGTRTVSALAVGAVATLGVAACSSGGGGKAGGSTSNKVTSTQSPRQAVATAVSNVGAQSNVEFQLSLPISQSQAEQLKDKTGSGPDPAEAKALTTGTIFITSATGHGEALDSAQARTDHQSSIDLGLSFGSDTPLELRYVGQNLYLHVEAQQLLTDVGQPASDAAKFTSTLNELNAYVPGISDLGQGKWVELSQASLQPLAAQLKQMEGSAAVNSTQFQTQVLKLRTELLAAIQANSAMTGLGTSNGRDEYSVTVNVSNMLNTVIPEIQSTLSSIPGFSSEASNAFNQVKSKIPAGRSAVIDVYVSHDKLTEADLDLNQFATQKKSFAVPLRLTVSSPGAPVAPSGATNLDLSKLPSLLQGLLGSLGHSSSSASSATTSASAA